MPGIDRIYIPLDASKRLSLEMTLDSGQAFRWYRCDEATSRNTESFVGVIGRSVLKVTGSPVNLEVSLLKGDLQSIGDLRAWAQKYFDLGTDYTSLTKSLAGNDRVLREAAAFAPGLRILKQDPWETLICFILSANNNIPRIKSIVKSLSREYGEPIAPEPYEHVFPAPEALAEADETDLRKATGMGFRAPYVIAAANAVASGELPVWALNELPTEEAREHLMKLKGVGRKIADCVLLFSMQKFDAFPIDVWAKRALETLYFGGQTKPLSELQEFAAAKFGDLRGYAQNYLFYYIRETFKNRKTG